MNTQDNIERERPHRTGSYIFLLGILLLISVYIVGSTIQPRVETLGMDGYLATTGAGGVLAFFLFAVGFPLGLGLCAVGAVHGRKGDRRGVWLFTSLTLTAGCAAVIVPVVFGRQLGGAFFGAGGTSIMVLYLLGIWFWGLYRSRIDARLRGPADLQAAGYVCFAIAAWDLCGVGGMPSFLLSPDKAMALQSHAFAVGQMKSVMALLVAGWLFTVLGLHRAAKLAATKPVVTVQTPSFSSPHPNPLPGGRRG